MSTTRSRKHKYEYGLKTYDIGDWSRREDSLGKQYLQNTKTGFRVVIQYPNPRTGSGTKIIVSSNEFSMGFSVAKNGFRNAEADAHGDPTIVIDEIGGRYYSEIPTKSGYPVLADANQFGSRSQQEDFTNALCDAVPRMPVTINHASRWDGGFGFKIVFEGEAKQMLVLGG